MSSLFNDDVYIFGDYSRIIKKFSSTSDKDSESWKVSNGNDAAEIQKPFGTYIDCLYAAAAIGLARNKKIKQDSFTAAEKKNHANILSSAWRDRSKDFFYLYRLMLLTDPDLSLSKDERVKKAFTDVPDAVANVELAYFLSYAYGGLVEMEKMFDAVHDYKEFADLLSTLVLEYQGDEE
jgi:hypothetical protein